MIIALISAAVIRRVEVKHFNIGALNELLSIT
jgi:hypothetical protein